jgi:hypothetical protein
MGLDDNLFQALIFLSDYYIFAPLLKIIINVYAVCPVLSREG